MHAKTRGQLGLLAVAVLAASVVTPVLPGGVPGAAASPMAGLSAAAEDVGRAWFTDGQTVWALDIATGSIDAPHRYQLPDDLPYLDAPGDWDSPPPSLVDVSDDGRWLLFAGAHEALVLDSQTGEVAEVVAYDRPTADGPFTVVGQARFRTGAAEEVVLSRLVEPVAWDADGQPLPPEVTFEVHAWQSARSSTLTIPQMDGWWASDRFLLSPDGRYLTIDVRADTVGQDVAEWAPASPSLTLIAELDTGMLVQVDSESAGPGTIGTVWPLEWIGNRRLFLERSAYALVDGQVVLNSERFVLDPATGAVTSAPERLFVDGVPTYGTSDLANFDTVRSFDGQQLTVVQDTSRRVESVRIVGLDGSAQRYPVDELLQFNDGAPPVRFRLRLVAWTPPEAVYSGDGTGVREASPAHRDAIRTAVTDGLLLSCAPFRFCSGEPTTRRTMALALATALDLPDPGPAAFAFADVGTDDAAAGAIRALVSAGITLGCQDGTVYCPDDPVRRDQMATFFTRAFRLPVGDPGRFDDVDESSVHAPGIGAVARAGITVGCGDGSGFCPGDPIRRDQMATFLDRRP